MPIAINNSIPSIKFYLRLILEAEDCMRILVNTCAAMNTGNIDYYLWVMSQCPTMVAEHLKCDPNTKYDIVKLFATLDLNVTHQPNTHGQMTTIIRYDIPYLVHGKDPLILSFALGDNISLRSVFGIPTLLAVSATIDL